MTGKPATIKEIAKILNVSISTVSRSLSDHPSIGITTRLKVKKVAKELSYERNETAVFFQKGKTFTIGVILPDLSEAFFSSAISAIEDTAYKRNYTVLLAQSHDEYQKEKQLLEKMKSHRIDGLLVSVAKNTSTFEHFDMLKNCNIPVVFFDRIPPIPNIHYVSSNIETGTVEAVNYLLKRGHRSIGMINGPATLAASGERREGYIQAMLKNRLKFDPTLLLESDLTEEGTCISLDKLLQNKRKPSAIITFNDYISLYAIKHARSKQIKINQDIEFVSYSNLPLVNFMDHIPIASVEQFPYLQGQKATDVLLDLLSKKNTVNQHPEAFYQIVLESQLIEKKRKQF